MVGCVACVGDLGYKLGETARYLAVGAVQGERVKVALDIAKANFNQLRDNYKQQNLIHDRAVGISEDQQEHLRSHYWPKELEFLAEYVEPGEQDTVYEAGRRHAARLMSTIAGKFAVEFKKISCSTSRYCSSERKKKVQDLHMVKAQAMNLAQLTGTLIGFYEVMSQEDKDFDRRRTAIALGSGLMDQAANFYGNASQGLAQAGQTLAGMFSNSLESLGHNVQNFGSTIQDFRANRQGRQQSQRTNSMANVFGQAGSMDAVPNGFQLGGGFEELTSGGFQQRYKDSEYFQTNPLDESMNDARVGARDLARHGFAEFPTSNGGVVVVSMEMFQLDHVDCKDCGMYG